MKFVDWLKRRASRTPSTKNKLLELAQARLEQGMTYYEEGQFDDAIAAWQKVLQLYQQSNHPQGEVEALNHLGIAHSIIADYEIALEFHQRQLALAQQTRSQSDEFKAYNGLGTVFYFLGQYQRAIETHQQALAIAEALHDQLSIAMALGNLGNAYEVLGSYSQATHNHQEALKLFEEIDDPQGQANSLGNLGFIHYATGDSRKAIRYYQQALSVFDELRDRYQQANVLTHLGNAYHDLGQYETAENYHQRALEMCQMLGERQGEGNALNNLGNTYYACGEYRTAISYHQQALEIAQAIGNPRGEANALSNLGNDYDALGQYIQVVAYHQQSLNICREIEDRRGEAIALNNLGSAYNSLGQYQKAIEYYQQSLEIAHQSRNQREEVQTLNSLGSAYDSLEQYEQAIQYHTQQLSLARDIEHRQGEANALGGLGNAYDTLGQYQTALEYHQQSLVIKRELGDRQGESTCLNNLGRVHYLLGQYQQAIEYHQQSLTLARTIGDVKGEGTSLNNLGIAVYQMGNLSEAEQLLYQGMQVWESLRTGLKDTDKISLSSEQTRIYYLLQLALIGQEKVEEALLIAERGRARAFAELLSQRFSTQAQEFPTPLTIKQIQQIAQLQNATLVEYSIAYDYVDLENRKQVRESKLLIWVIQPNGDIAFRVVDLSQLWNQQKIFLYHLILAAYEPSDRNMINIDNASSRSNFSWAQQLYQLLIQPVHDLLPQNSEHPIVFIPQDSLFLVPFAGLQDPDGKFLIESHTIQISPSIQILELTRQRRDFLVAQARKSAKNAPVLVVGNPTMPTFPLSDSPEPLEQLPGSEAEAIAIASLLNTSAMLGKQATKATVIAQMAQARLIHFATHGIWEDVRLLGVPEAIAEVAPGGIALAPENADNGFLVAGEILNLQLQANLVVLSACVTGLGRLSGDGLIGLSRALIAAGTPSVIVSLWSVDDQATIFLMLRFYQDLQILKSPALALRNAQCWLLNCTRKDIETWFSDHQAFFAPILKRPTLRYQLKRYLNAFAEDAYPFQNPHFWAAFQAIGQ